MAAADRALAFAILGAWMREQAGRADREAWWLSEAMVRGAPPDPRRDPLQTQPTNGARTATELNLPAERTWAFQPEQAVLTAEWCRSLIALHRLPSVLGATEAWRDQVGGNRFAQAMLAMAAADGMLQDDRIDQAVELIDLAQGILGQVRGAAYAGSDEAPDVRLGRAMVDDLAQCIHRRMEVERYGPGWVAYRDADALSRRDGELFGAMAGFRKVDQEYPGTILAVAGRANRLVLQLQTSTKAYQAERQAWLKRARAQIDNLRQRLTQIEHDGFTSVERIAAQRALTAEQAGILAAFQEWPTDPRASGEQAWREAEAFIAEKPEGVYRCDVLLAQADWIWGETGDAGRARQRYDALLEWLVQVPARDSAVDGYIFEERIRAASAPPPTAIQQDDFGNQRWAALPPGTLINHRTCPWYVEYLTMRAAAGAGVCAFSVGDFAAASAYVDRLAKADPFEALRLAGKLQVSNTSRLRDGFATGRLFATAPELALFGGQERSQLLSAEVAYECEEWQRALNLYRVVGAGLGDRSRPGQECYLQFMVANCLLALHPEQLDEPKSILGRCSKEFTGTPTWPRIQIGLWNILQWDDATRSQGLTELGRLITADVPQAYRDEALFHRAQHYVVVRRDWPTAKAWFNHLTSSSVPWIRQGAANWLDDTIRQKQGLP